MSGFAGPINTLPAGSASVTTDLLLTWQGSGPAPFTRQIPASQFLGGLSVITASVLAASIATTASVFASTASTSSSGASLIGFLQQGTSSVGRTIQSKLQEVFSVKDFGAKGDGVTDDTTAIQNCANAVVAHGPASMYFPGGCPGYKVSSPITMSPTTTIVVMSDGPGSGTILPSTLSKDVFRVTCGAGGSVVFQGMTVFYGTRSSTAGIVFRFITAGALGSGVVNCRSSNQYTLLSLEGANDQNIIVSGVVSNGGLQNGIEFLSGFGGNSMISDVVLNTDTLNTGSGIVLQAGDGNSFSNIEIQGYEIGINAVAAAGQSVLDCFFSNVDVDNAVRGASASVGWVFDGSAASASVNGVYFSNCWGSSNSSGSGFSFNAASNVTMQGCISLNNGQTGINFNGNCSDIAVHGCIISGNSQTSSGTYNGLTFGASALRFSAMGNRIGSTPRIPTPSQGFGIAVAGTVSDYFVIQGNVLYGNVTGEIQNLSTSSVHTSVTGNV